MLKLIKNSFIITNDCIILAVPLIVFLSILGWYWNYSVDAINTIPKFILACITMLVMSSGFVAAWLYMTKKTIELSKKVFVFDKDRAKALAKLVTALPKGLGKLFLPIIGVISTYILIALILFSIINFILANTIGSFDFSNIDFTTLFLSTESIYEEIKLLSDNEILNLNLFYLLTIVGLTIISFLTMLWIPEIIYNEKNSYKALYFSIKKIFSTFKSSLLLFVYIYTLIILITILNTLLMFNPFLYFFVLLLYYYFLVYIVVLLFSYYEQKFL